MTEVQTQPTTPSSTGEGGLPEYKTLEKVLSIPLVSDSLLYAHSIISANPYTAYVYNTSLGLGTTAFEYSKPVQTRLAPIIGKADGIALRGLDAVESRFPYPFKTSADDIVNQLKSSSDAAYTAFHNNVQAPAYGVAKNADRSLSPIVDKLEYAVNSIGGSSQLQDPSSSSPGDTTTAPVEETQVGRAYRLGLDLKDKVYTLSGEQLKLVQQHNAIVQKATETVYKLNASLSAFSKDTSAKAHTISQSILSELEKVQHSAAALPSHIQSSLRPLQTQLSSTLSALKSILQSDGTAGQKASEVASTVQKDVGPVLEAFKESASKILSSPKGQVTEVSEEVAPPSLEPGITSS